MTSSGTVCASLTWAMYSNDPLLSNAVVAVLMPKIASTALTVYISGNPHSCKSVPFGTVPFFDRCYARALKLGLVGNRNSSFSADFLLDCRGGQEAAGRRSVSCFKGVIKLGEFSPS